MTAPSNNDTTTAWLSGWYLSGVTTGEFENATWMVLHLNDDLKEVVSDARAALGGLIAVHGGWGHIVLRGGITCHVLGLVDEERLAKIFPNLELPEGDEVVYVGEHFDDVVILDKEYWASENRGLHIAEDHVYVVAHGKHTDGRVESHDVSEFFAVPDDHGS